MPSPNLYACETRIVSGLGCIRQLPQELATWKISRPVLVVDRGIAETGGVLEEWLSAEVLDGLNVKARILAGMNPDLDAVREAIVVAKNAGGKGGGGGRGGEQGCDGVVIVGGGSSICLGKAVALMCTNQGDVLDYEGSEKMRNMPLPTICIPTTAGSGSEVSRVLVLHEHARPTEIVIRGFGTEPRVALLDGNVLLSCPRKPFLDASLDAITHACESLWSRRRTLITDALAEKALSAMLTHLPSAINDRNPEACQAILEASSAANLACGNTGLALIHALTMSPDVPLAHGYQNGCLLLAVAAFNRPYMDPQHQTLIDQLPDLFQKLEWPGVYNAGDIDDYRASLMIRASTGNPFRTNNIRESSDAECYDVLCKAGAQISAPA